MTELAASLVGPIQEGSFPESSDLLSSDLSADALNNLVAAITNAKDELSHELRNVSRPYAGGVDEWILQAKNVQQDIARCKRDASDIVQEHSRLEQLRREASDAENKVKLLSDEVAFTKDLQAQLRSIAAANQRLRYIEGQEQDGNTIEAAQALNNLQETVQALQGPRVRSVFSDYRDDLLSRVQGHLSSALLSRIVLQSTGDQMTLLINDVTDTPNARLFSALKDLDSAEALVNTVDDLVTNVFSQVLATKPARRLLSHTVQNNTLTVVFNDTHSHSVSHVLRFSSDLVVFLRERLPADLYNSVATHLGPRLISSLVGDWLTPAIPISLDDLVGLDELKQEVLSLAKILDDNHWPKTEDLGQWIKHAPRMWIGKRKAEALDAVRRAFFASSGMLHQVERIERRRANTLDTQLHPSSADADAENDWDASWDDEGKTTADPVHQKEIEDDASGWGFDDDMDGGPAKSGDNANGHGETAGEDEDEVDEAWGWGEDTSEPPAKAMPELQKGSTRPVNGLDSKETSAAQELVLSELYSITDIPDRLIECIGRDIQDALRLEDEGHASLKDIPASSGLLALPSLSLAMFRATASINYSKNLALGNMNLYNDSLYIGEKLQNMPKPPGMKDVDADCAAMEKFARAAYAREMETQRTILSDLLDGVQGFTIPYAEQIEEAICATSDRLRQVHQEWSPILSTSALLQSIGALYASVLSKVITDIEEMDDISEAQSQRLSNFCAQLGKLEDLFIARPPGEGRQQEDAVPMVALYTSNWLRFQYLDQLLSASLVDIKYLWTEGELSLEFSADEVVDLIKALFAESSHRRSAIAAIRGHRGSGMS